MITVLSSLCIIIISITINYLWDIVSREEFLYHKDERNLDFLSQGLLTSQEKKGSKIEKNNQMNILVPRSMLIFDVLYLDPGPSESRRKTRGNKCHFREMGTESKGSLLTSPCTQMLWSIFCIWS